MDAIRNTIAENFGGVAVKATTHPFELSQVPDQSGKVAVITGGSEGIGYGCTHTLLTKNAAKVFILSVSADVVAGAQRAIAADLGEAAAARTEWIQCEMSDWTRVHAVAEQIKSQTDRLDIVINNAARGIMTAQTTPAGIDRHMAVNHFGPAVLVAHLLPLLERTAAQRTVRVVNVASNAHVAAPSGTRFASVAEINEDAGPNGQYGRSKLAAILHARYLAAHVTRRTPGLLANATHPGFVRTKMSTEDIHEPYPLGGYAMSVGMAPFQKDQFEGCVSTMFAATKTEQSGQYLCPPAVPEPGSSLSQDATLGEQLMKLTREVIAAKTTSDSVDKGCPIKDAL